MAAGCIKALAPRYSMPYSPGASPVFLAAAGNQSPFAAPTRLWQRGNARPGQALDTGASSNDKKDSGFPVP